MVRCCSRKSFFLSFQTVYGAANVVIGGLHYNASLQQTELTMLEFYWCRIITGIIDAIRE
jgi:hypothetical protein